MERVAMANELEERTKVVEGGKVATDTWIEDDSDVIDVIDSAKAAWFSAHSNSELPATDEITDGDINESLGLPRGGALRDLSEAFADWSKDDITAAVNRGLDNWYNRAGVRYALLVSYSAPPEAERFEEISISELERISEEINESERSSAQTEWSRDAWETDRETCTQALSLCRAGQTILIAQDEDGYYFATERR